MSELPDQAERQRALSDLGATLLVEAAAGTGKTSLIAGRTVMLLASGVDPGSICAITFTELAASELATRIHDYIQDLLRGDVPECLKLVLPEGLDGTQRRALEDAAARRDQLVVSTIHAFCQTMICSYAVDANIDPGASMLDAIQAEAAFNDVFNAWLRRRFSRSVRREDPLAALSRDDPQRVVRRLLDLARFHQEHRHGTIPPADSSGRPDRDLVEAVADFRRWLNGIARPERNTLELVGQLEQLALPFTDSFAGPLSFARLWELAHPELLPCMGRQFGRRRASLQRPRNKQGWVFVAGRVDGERLNDEALHRFDRVDACYRNIMGRISGAIVTQLGGEIDEMLAEYRASKRAAALLDFDDLLEYARRLLREHDDVRRALANRYRHVLVDEYQDTDPIQSEILFLLGAEEVAPEWEQCRLRAGALFLVGDPKQSIYRFRGADVSCYRRARDAIRRQWLGNVLHVTANFRSRPDILEYVNRCFAEPFSVAGQPDYVALAATLPAPDHGLPCVARLEIDPRARFAEETRDAEAEAVAALCTKLIGNFSVKKGDVVAPLTAGGIALLAPGGTELWRYERALEEKGLAIASQAGKGLFRRQEVQDLLCLTRALADPLDTIAFGALMRGPLVGLTEDELLEITTGLPVAPGDPSGIPRFSLLTDAEAVGHPMAQRVLVTLQALRRRAHVVTPALLLAEAVERLAVPAVLAARDPEQSSRAAANVEAFVERARGYGVKGLAGFVRDIGREWSGAVRQGEGDVDADGEAIQVITVHSAKGLEWPVVIPINCCSWVDRSVPFIYRFSNNTLHWIIDDVVPPELSTAQAEEAREKQLENERLWYVACTRARELLVIPELPNANDNSWARIVNLATGGLPTLDLREFPERARATTVDAPNRQTAEAFAAEVAAIAARAKPLTWQRPSEHDADRAPVIDAIMLEEGDAPEAELPIGAGKIRGLVLHKLIEEILTGELPEKAGDLQARAGELIEQLEPETEEGAAAPSPAELSATVLKTLRLPEIAALRPMLVGEIPIFAAPDPWTAIAGRVDALAYDAEGRPVVIDWKSDAAPTEATIKDHVGQLADYCRIVGADRGALVYMTQGFVRWIAAGAA